MTPASPPAAEADLVFTRSANANLFGWLFLLAGAGAFLFASLGFVLAIVANLDQLAMHSITTMPAILGVAAFAGGWSLLSAPQQVVVGAKGLTITNRGGDVHYGWDQIAWAKVDAVLMGSRKALYLYDTRGKKVAQLSDAFSDFDQLVEAVKRRTTGTEAAERVQQMKGRQAAWICLGVGGVILAVCAFLVYDSYQKQRGEQLLASQGVPGQAAIERRFIAPNGVTARVEYRINEQSGSRNVEVERGYWDSLEGATTVPVMYVPGEPQFSSLLQGEVKSTDFLDSPAGGMTLAGVASLLGLFLLGVGVMQFLGWDIDLDSKTGKLSVKRFGEGR